ncbi:alpha/beta hydrolase family protein [Mangrovibacterium sp.]|uniref:alpha/beta hydrolase family protein n=1 Tax=Mangrovibacterium sp. TaxID=1961364 RepID=UPI0035665DE5
MLKQKTYYFCLIASIFAVVTFSGCKSQKGTSQQAEKVPANGPQWVKNSLTNVGVFNVPEVIFTEKFDEHKQHENIKGLFFNGLNFHGKQTNVFCWYGVPETLKDGDKAPAVVLVHGGGGTVFPQWVKKWTDQGYIAISVALEGQVPGPKTEKSPLEAGHPNHKLSGPFRKGFFLDLMEEKLEDQWFYHAVADIIMANSLLRSFPEVDTTKIGITGISWGGILTNVVTGIDNRFAFAIPVYGCGFLHEAPTYIGQLEAHTPESKQFYLENWEPSLYAPLQNHPTLFVNGTNDGHFSMNSFTKTYKASGAYKYLHVEHEMQHGHGAGWNPEEIYRFADYVVGRGKEQVKFKFNTEKNTVNFDGELREAFAYYTNDTADWSAKSYKWLKADVLLSNSTNTIKVELPESAVYYFVNGIDTEGLMHSSPMVKIECNEPK